MASEQRKPFFLFRPRFVLFCLYVALYAWLRHEGEIAMQAISLPSPRGVEVYRTIGANPSLPYWRQQLWRAFFSFLMVGEEEGRKLKVIADDLYHEAQGTVNTVQDYLPGRQQQSQAPQFQQQYQPQYQQQGQARQYQIQSVPQQAQAGSGTRQVQRVETWQDGQERQVWP